MKKVCLITGSTQGVGLAIAEKLGQMGYKVIISSRKEENSYRAEELLKLKNIDYDYYMCNFDVRQQRQKLAQYIEDKYGKLDSLVTTVSANAYIGESIAINEKEFDKIFDTNVKNTFFTIMDYLPLLRKSKSANIVITSSHSGYVPFPFLGIVSISKTALFSLTKILARELAEFNIRVNCIAPGLVRTRMSQRNIYNDLSEDVYMKRDAMPHEIAGVVYFLNSDDANYVNGEVISVNGGMMGRL